MKCLKCNYENIEGSRFCQNCGSNLELQAAPAPSIEVPPTYTPTTFAEPNFQTAYNPAAARLTAAAGDSLYLVICILLSVSALFSLSVVTVLIAIFSWLCFAAAKKGNIQSNHLRVISGAVYADYIVTKILGILLIVLGALLAIIFIAGGPTGFLMDFLFKIVPNMDNDLFYKLPSAFFSAFGVGMGIGLVIAGIAVIIITNLGLKKIHRFAKSVYKSVESGCENYEHTNAIGGWLIAYSVMNASSALTYITSKEPFACIAAGAIAAVGIIAFIIYKKYFLNNK